jgi:hypothetical protein
LNTCVEAVVKLYVNTESSSVNAPVKVRGAALTLLIKPQQKRKIIKKRHKFAILGMAKIS